GDHAEVFFGSAVEGEAGVVLLLDVGGVLDPEALDHMAADVHAQDVAGVGAHFLGVIGQLNAAGLAPAADLDLCFDDDGVAGPVGSSDRVVDGVGGAAGGDGDAVLREVLLALVFEEVHAVAYSLGAT